jgi:hypothetical protein
LAELSTSSAAVAPSRELHYRQLADLPLPKVRQLAWSRWSVPSSESVTVNGPLLSGGANVLPCARRLTVNRLVAPFRHVVLLVVSFR